MNEAVSVGLFLKDPGLWLPETERSGVYKVNAQQPDALKR